MSVLLIVLLAWAAIAFVVLVAGFVITSNKEPPRYFTLTVIAEPSAENVDEPERKAA